MQKGELFELLKFTVYIPLSSSSPQIRIEVSEFNTTVSMPQPPMGSPHDIDERTGVRKLIGEILGLHDPSAFSSSIQEQNKQTQGKMPESRHASLHSELEPTTVRATERDANIKTPTRRSESRSSTHSGQSSRGSLSSSRSTMLSGMSLINTALPSNQAAELPEKRPITPTVALSVELEQIQNVRQAVRVPEIRRILSLNWAVCYQRL